MKNALNIELKDNTVTVERNPQSLTSEADNIIEVSSGERTLTFYSYGEFFNALEKGLESANLERIAARNQKDNLKIEEETREQESDMNTNREEADFRAKQDGSYY